MHFHNEWRFCMICLAAPSLCNFQMSTEKWPVFTLNTETKHIRKRIMQYTAKTWSVTEAKLTSLLTINRLAVQGHPRSMTLVPCNFLLDCHSNLGPSLHHFWATATYWLKIANFPTSPLYGTPAPYVPFAVKLTMRKLVMGLSSSENRTTIA